MKIPFWKVSYKMNSHFCEHEIRHAYIRLNYDDVSNFYFDNSLNTWDFLLRYIKYNVNKIQLRLIESNLFNFRSLNCFQKLSDHSFCRTVKKKPGKTLTHFLWLSSRQIFSTWVQQSCNLHHRHFSFCPYCVGMTIDIK